ncbi:MAG TPA: carbohydrate ABC transporter permease [Victivallales bacterium]|nr:carbohydrate ABC transporter permease [Victivallales bacterium]
MSNSKKYIAKTVKYAILIFTAILVILPILVVLFGALKTQSQYATTNIITPPTDWFNFQNFKIAFVEGKMWIGLMNTSVLLLVSLTFSTLFGAMVAYVLQRFKFFGRDLIFNLFIVAILVPSITLQVTIFQVISNLGLYNTIYSALILYVGTDVISIYIFMQFLTSIPKAIDESGIIDGASYFTIFFKLIFPLLKPAIVTVVIIKGIGIYNDFYVPLLYMPAQRLKTLSTSLYSFIGPYGSSWQIICAGVILIIIPSLIVFICLQKYIYNGFVSGSVKS